MRGYETIMRALAARGWSCDAEYERRNLWPLFVYRLLDAFCSVGVVL